MLTTNYKTWRNSTRSWKWRERVTRESLTNCKLLLWSIWNSMPWSMWPLEICYVYDWKCQLFIYFNFFFFGYRIQKDLVDPEKLQATLADKTLTEDCGLKRALEMVALIEAQLKEMNPNLDSISEYAFSLLFMYDVSWNLCGYAYFIWQLL